MTDSREMTIELLVKKGIDRSKATIACDMALEAVKQGKRTIQAEIDLIEDRDTRNLSMCIAGTMLRQMSEDLVLLLPVAVLLAGGMK